MHVPPAAPGFYGPGPPAGNTGLWVPSDGPSRWLFRLEGPPRTPARLLVEYSPRMDAP
jgi:hypothetical protein